MKTVKCLSLGWGVQSWTLAAMAALDKIPKPDFIFHSDTTHEFLSTYEFAKKWSPWLEKNGVGVTTVCDKQSVKLVETPTPCIPAFTKDGKGKKGQLLRVCTERWKIRPIRRFLTTFLAQNGKKKSPGCVELSLGISLDEWERMKTSDVKYIAHKFPLVDMRMSRLDCLNFLKEHSLPSPGKSACVFCPYHNTKTWEDMRRGGGQDWKKACGIDETIREAREGYETFLLSNRTPLSSLTLPENSPIRQLGFDIPCDSGYCFM